ncbi:MAG: pilus assembly protein [Variovorax sp.]|nr:pilus assembly protein [Variovorax sp.]
MNNISLRSDQRGISIFVVMVVVLLGTLLVLWSSRSALLNEMLTGNDSDYQRALEAAHALVRDAELDIRGENADGSPCASPCRQWGVLDAASKKVFYPTDVDEWHDLQAILAPSTPSCIAGICEPDGVTEQFWRSKENLEAMKQVGASYGDFTGAKSGLVSNPLLASGRGWYWVEILPYNMGAQVDGGPARELAPDRKTPYLYRITAVVQGIKQTTQAVVQTTVVWKIAES